MATFSALFVSLKRLSEILPTEAFFDCNGASSVSAVSDFRGRLQLLNAIEQNLESWLLKNHPPTIGELIVRGKLKPGIFFTHYGAFFGGGIIDAATRFQQEKPLKKKPLLRADLANYNPNTWLEMQAHPRNFTANSSPIEMSGKKRLFAIGRITDIKKELVSAQAYAVGQLHNEERSGPALGDHFNRLPWQMETFIQQIQPFDKASQVPSARAGELRRLLTIPENDVKHAFAEIIGEPFVPKDWGGEKSDLVSTRMHFNNESIMTAFAFKGPAKPKPLTVADLGKHGDQISRLFSEPADLIILQHCHSITGAVRDHMRAFATRIGRLRPFCLIDGADTVRILRTFGKLGF